MTGIPDKERTIAGPAPAYLADISGTQMGRAIPGRLLSAWSAAGSLGPVVVTSMREYRLGLGIPREQVYKQTRYILTDAERAAEKRRAHVSVANFFHWPVFVTRYPEPQNVV